MPSKPKAPALDRLVRRESRRAVVAQGEWLPTIEYTREDLRVLMRRVASECARIADESGRFRQDAVDAICRQFGIEEGEDG